jgi:hypothetical protein
MGNCTTAITFAWLVGPEVAQLGKDATSGRKHLFGCDGGVGMTDDSTQYIARISYGKDSLKMLERPPKFVADEAEQMSLFWRR